MGQKNISDSMFKWGVKFVRKNYLNFSLTDRNIRWSSSKIWPGFREDAPGVG